ncbi:MAG: alpha-1,2-fucosyltransferase [Thiotrichales bacterium]|nr:alpha-1,2-fucosyltransferase [Thiotrichales bacterium]
MTRVYVHLIGGLGNQMFQYAAARAVTLRNDADLILDTTRTPMKGGGNHHLAFALGHFAIAGRIGDASDLPPSRNRPVRHTIWRMTGRSPRYIRERGLAFNSNIISLEPNCYLHGYFQSDRYFNDVSDQIRKELTIITQPDPVTRRWLHKIQTSNAISLHVRRGDYVTNAKFNAVFATCRPDYYRRAAGFIADQIAADPEIYAFSDDIDWVRKNLELPFKMHFVDHNDYSTAYNDMRLMAACRHHVIANSSFSWWGAWLNSSEHKIVVAPAQWYRTARRDNPDITPGDWHLL